MIISSLSVAGSAGASGNHTFMIDGEYCPESEQNVNALATGQIARFNAEYTVITVNALNGDGAMDFSIEEAEVARAMIAQARQLIVITDSSKLDRCALFQVFLLNRTNRLAVDRRSTGKPWEALQQARVEIHEASLRTPQV